MVTVYYPLAQSKQDLQYAKLRSFTVNGNKGSPVVQSHEAASCVLQTPSYIT